MNYNKLIVLRTKLRNKLYLNKLKNSTIYIEETKDGSKNDELTIVGRIPEDQMALFLGVNEVIYKEPKMIEKFTLKEGNHLLQGFEYESCYRCDEK